MQHRYRPIDIPRDIFALLTNRVLFRLGFGMVGIFLPIFFYQLFGDSLSTLLVLYAVLYALSVPLVPLGALLLGTLGIRRMLILSVPFAALSVSALYYAPAYPELATALFVVAIIIYRVLYWVPYHTDLAHFIGRGGTGGYMAVYKNFIAVMDALTPLLGGFLIASFGFGNVFVFAGVVLLATIIPTRVVREVYERYSWGFVETFRKLTAQKNRALLYAYMADGAQSVVTAVIWPVFIFELLGENYISVGLVATLTTVMILVLNVSVGKFFDHVGERKALTYSSILAATGWVVKFFVDSAFQVFVADTYHRLGTAANRMSFDAATYEHSADNGHYIDEFTTLKEMALNIGRVLMLIAVGVLLYTVGNIRLVFVLAAGATMAMVALNRQLSVR